MAHAILWTPNTHSWTSAKNVSPVAGKGVKTMCDAGNVSDKCNPERWDHWSWGAIMSDFSNHSLSQISSGGHLATSGGWFWKHALPLGATSHGGCWSWCCRQGRGFPSLPDNHTYHWHSYKSEKNFDCLKSIWTQRSPSPTFWSTWPTPSSLKSQGKGFLKSSHILKELL